MFDKSIVVLTFGLSIRRLFDMEIDNRSRLASEFARPSSHGAPRTAASAPRQRLMGRLYARLYAQFRRPRGPLGWLVGQLMAVKNAERSRWVLEKLDPRPGEHILEVGFGSGADVARMIDAIGPDGVVTGIDASDVMVRLALGNNRRAVRRSRAVLQRGTVEGLPFADASFDAVYSVNCAQFWSDLDAAFAGLRRVTRPGGRAVIAVQPMNRGASVTDSQRWLTEFERAAESASWQIVARALGPQRVAAVVLRKEGR